MASSVATTTTLTSRKTQLASQPRLKDDASRTQLAAKAQQDFFWTYTEEPHRTRRQAIIKAHPEVLKLVGPEPLTKYLVALVVFIQLACAFLLRKTPFFSWQFLGTAYVIGATANQNLFLAIHEISHNLAFKSPAWNRALAVAANLPIGIPYSASFRPYHLTHHKSLGSTAFDADLPTPFEAMFLNSVAGKAFFCTFQLLFYAIRPMFVYQLPLTRLHLANVAVQLVFDVIIVRSWGWLALGYLILSSFLAGSLHPVAGHFIAEHYVLPESTLSTRRQRKERASGVTASAPKSQAASPLPKDTSPPETYSYYGPLNLVTYNVGLHNEHHDFPAVAWSRLPELSRIAGEFYDELPSHTSWVGVLWDFITGRDGGAGLWGRVRREGKVGERGTGLDARYQGE